MSYPQGYGGMGAPPQGPPGSQPPRPMPGAPSFAPPPPGQFQPPGRPGAPPSMPSAVGPPPMGGAFPPQMRPSQPPMRPMGAPQPLQPGMAGGPPPQPFPPSGPTPSMGQAPPPMKQTLYGPPPTFARGPPGAPPPAASTGPPMRPMQAPGAPFRPQGQMPPPPQYMQAQQYPPPGQPGPGTFPPPRGPGGPTPPQFGAGAPPPYGAAMNGGGVAGAEAILGQFQSLTMSAGGPMAPGGQTELGVDPAQFPRPVGNTDELHACFQGPPLDPLSCHKKYMRLSVNAIPNSAELKKNWNLPMAAVIQPMAPSEDDIPVVNFGSAGIIRCKHCRTYVNPYVQFTDGGRRWQCNVCGTYNEVPVEYFSATDGATGKRHDLAERPELSCGTVEYVAPAEYMVRAPMPPTFVFAIDVSYQAVQSGMLQTAVTTIKGCLDFLPGGERTQIGIITYDSTLHFYSMRAGKSPQMLVVPDIDNPYLPQPEDLLVNLQESREAVDAVLEVILKSFATTQEPDGGMGGAIQGAYLLMQSLGGKLLVFQSSVPTRGDGKLRKADDPSAYDTEGECKLRMPEDPFFKRFAGECNRVQMCVDIFCGAPGFTDVASITTWCSCTGGQFYYLPGFSARTDALKLEKEVRHNLMRGTGWEAVMRVRMGRGLKCTSFHGHFMIRSNDLMSLPTVDEDKAMLVQIGYEEQVVSAQRTFMQCALLYTTSMGERRIRVHTLAIPVVGDLAQMFKACDGPCAASVLAKLSAEKIRQATIKQTAQIVNGKCTDVLKEYRRLYSSHLSAHNKLILPENMKMLPLLVMAMQKCALLRPGRDIASDERANVVHQIMSMPFGAMMKFLYPTCVPLAGVQPSKPNQQPEVPPSLALSMNNLKDDGAYLFDNGQVMFLWVGRAIGDKWMREVLGVGLNATPQELVGLQVCTPLENTASKAVVGVVNQLRWGNALYQRCYVVRQGDPAESLILPWLIEDKVQGLWSYTDFLGYIHKGVQTRN